MSFNLDHTSEVCARLTIAHLGGGRDLEGGDFMSLANAVVTATLTVTDLEKAKAFYTEKLGLTPSSEVVDDPMGGALFNASGGTTLYIYQGGVPKATNTVAGFKVEDVMATVNELKAKGVEFESYDMPEIKTDENNIATFGSLQTAWFKDPDGNILAVENH